jgi:hypothetical protein
MNITVVRGYGRMQRRLVRMQRLALTVDGVETELHGEEHANALHYLILMDAQVGVVLKGEEGRQVDLQD